MLNDPEIVDPNENFESITYYGFGLFNLYGYKEKIQNLIIVRRQFMIF